MCVAPPPVTPAPTAAQDAPNPAPREHARFFDEATSADERESRRRRPRKRLKNPALLATGIVVAAAGVAGTLYGLEGACRSRCDGLSDGGYVLVGLGLIWLAPGQGGLQFQLRLN